MKPQSKKKRPRNQSKRKNADYAKDKERFGDEPKRSDTNDPAWYAQTPELLRDAASIPFSNVSGLPTKVLAEGTYVPVPGYQVSPGLITYSIVPVPLSRGHNSALNVAAKSLYSFVRHANSGSANYDAPDLMMYCLGVGQVYSYLNFLQRVYGCANMYSHANRYFPKALVRAQGVDFDSVINNLANFRLGINQMIYQISSFAVPADITYFNRLSFLFSGYYAEGDAIKSQMHMMVPDGFLFFEEMKAPAGALTYQALSPDGTALTVKQLLEYGRRLINPLMESESIGIMSGDILKAYGLDHVVKLVTVPEMYVIAPTVDLNVLEQLQNSMSIAGLSGTSAPSVSVNPTDNTITGDATIAASSEALALFERTLANIPLTTILTDPTAADVMERTRFMFTMVGTDTPGTTDTYSIKGGTELITKRYMWTYDSNNLLQSTPLPEIVAIKEDWMPTNASEALRVHCLLESFSFHPSITYVNVDAAGVITYVGQALDFNNYAYLNDKNIDNINDAAMLALFRVPSIGTIRG